MLLQRSTKSLLSVFPPIETVVDLRLPNQDSWIGWIERKRPGNLIQGSLLVAGLFEDERQGEMSVREVRMQRKRNLAVSVSKVESFGNSSNCIEADICEGEPGMSNGIARIQIRSPACIAL